MSADCACGKSGTPRTDAARGYYDDSGCWKSRPGVGETVHYEDMEQLERELAAARDELSSERHLYIERAKALSDAIVERDEANARAEKAEIQAEKFKGAYLQADHVGRQMPDERDEALGLLSQAQCPDCDGSGVRCVPHENKRTGELEPEPEQCEWCARRKAAVECAVTDSQLTC